MARSLDLDDLIEYWTSGITGTPGRAADLAVHRIAARADQKVTAELVNVFTRVTGKENRLFAIAEASRKRPDDAVRGSSRSRQR